MEYQLTSAVLAAHVGAGLIGAFVAFPAAFFARKGSPLHKSAGRAFVLAFVVICLTSYALDFQELTGVDIYRWWADPNMFRLGFDMPIDIKLVQTAAITTFALYLAVSGWRMWARRRRHAAGRSAPLDVVLAMAALFAVGAFVIATWKSADWFSAEGQSVSALSTEHLVILALGLVVAGEAFLDLRSILTRRAPRYWWFVHMRRMLLAEAGLLAAIALRCWPAPDVGLGMALPVAAFVLIGLVMTVRGLRAAYPN
ncbi:hypothetical protein [Bauldia sp.]|uniref:hypothetical protein n=1 Tax=Bauldia sp. TaxID=2575872 RepID=UPI003BAB15DD